MQDASVANAARPPIVDIRPAPTRRAADGPVMIGDCITPAGGTTLLALMWRRLDRDGPP